MSEPIRRVYDLLSDCDHTSSLPIDVASAAVHYDGADGPCNSLVYLQTVKGNELDIDSRIIGYKVKDTGGVLLADNQEGAWACPIGRLENVVDHIAENTDYIITEKRGRFKND